MSCILTDFRDARYGIVSRAKRSQGIEMLLIELNEFNGDLLRSLAQAQRLRHVEEVLNWHHAVTWTGDE